MTENPNRFLSPRDGAATLSGMPTVTVIVPCYNEQDTIQLLLLAIYQQTYPRQNIEVVVADGLSTDQTRVKIQEFVEMHTELVVRIVDNPDRTIPAGLNYALRAAVGQIVVRLDAHCVPRMDYVQKCVEDLQQELGDNVGGVWEIQPLGETSQARAIAWAASHPLAVGDAHYRYSARAQLTDTVPFGAYKRALIDRIGFYNEKLLTNEDYEFNSRIRRQGGKIWLDPAIRSIYFARPTLHALFKQYWRYGYWKAQMLRLNPDTLRWRHVLPPAFVLGIVLTLILGFWVPFIWNLLGLVLLVYVLALAASGIQAAWNRKEISLVMLVALAIATMHMSWGTAFLWGLPQKRIDRS